MNNFAVEYSRSGMADALHKLKLSYTRPTYGKHEGVKLLGILNYETGHVYCAEDKQYNAQTFLSFPQDVLSIYTTGKIVMILDNAVSIMQNSFNHFYRNKKTDYN
jgi:hypothetical protein